MNLETKQFKGKLQAQVLVLHERKVLQKENFKIYKKKKKLEIRENRTSQTYNEN